MNRRSLLAGVLVGLPVGWLIAMLAGRRLRWPVDSEAEPIFDGSTKDYASLNLQPEGTAGSPVGFAGDTVKESATSDAGVVDSLSTPLGFAGSAPPVEAQTVAQPFTAQVADDLTVIEGIGPKIAELLNQAGVHTFAELAHRDAGQLRDILDAGGPRFRIANPATWPRQAQLAGEGDWEGLKALQASLRAGRDA